jgi:caa(3)-type oxidase subunit IV
MADENKTPEELTDVELEAVAHSVPKPDEYPKGQGKELAKELTSDSTGLEEAAVAGLRKTEELSEKAVPKAWDAGISGIQDAIESFGTKPQTPHEALASEHHGDTTVLFGKEYPVPLYTAVFGALAVLTLIEVLIAEIFTTDVKIPFLIGIAVAKALLVVLFYMHLRDDNRIFALVLAVPLGIATLSALFLLAVPTTGY